MGVAVDAGDMTGYLTTDRAFHRAFVERANNPPLTKMVMQLRDDMRLYGIVVPAKLFWSVTVYDSETRSMVQTDTNIAARSSYDKLEANSDGSVDPYFGPAAPKVLESNWVKTPQRQGVLPDVPLVWAAGSFLRQELVAAGRRTR